MPKKTSNKPKKTSNKPKKTSNKPKKTSKMTKKTSQKSHLENIHENIEEIEKIDEITEEIDEIPEETVETPKEIDEITEEIDEIPEETVETQEVIDEIPEETVETQEIIDEIPEEELLSEETEDKQIEENEEEEIEQEESGKNAELNIVLDSKDENLNASKLSVTSEVLDNSESSQNPDNNGIQEIDIESDKYADIDVDDDEKFREMLKDFSDLDDGDFNMEEILEIQNAMEEVQEEDKGSGVPVNTESSSGEGQAIFDPYEGWGIYKQKDLYEGWGIYDINTENEAEPFQPGEISEELEAKIQEELARKRKAKKLVTEEMFKEYCTDRRDKIWYFALWYLVFSVEDHQATKGALYEALKEDTSKSAIDPTPEHKFYFGLGFILRLKIMEHKIIDFKGDLLKLNVGSDLLTDLLREVGPPISNRPVITEKEKKNMYIDFLTDDFNDI